MLEDDVSSKSACLIKSYDAETKVRVRASVEEPCTFELESGIRQRCLLSPMLFNFPVNCAMQRSKDDNQGVQVSTDCHFMDLEFVVLRGDLTTFQASLERINK